MCFRTILNVLLSSHRQRANDSEGSEDAFCTRSTATRAYKSVQGRLPARYALPSFLPSFSIFRAHTARSSIYACQLSSIKGDPILARCISHSGAINGVVFSGTIDVRQATANRVAVVWRSLQDARGICGWHWECSLQYCKHCRSHRDRAGVVFCGTINVARSKRCRNV
jgi:hypothetical protein